MNIILKTAVSLGVLTSAASAQIVNGSFNTTSVIEFNNNAAGYAYAPGWSNYVHPTGQTGTPDMIIDGINGNEFILSNHVVNQSPDGGTYAFFTANDGSAFSEGLTASFSGLTIGEKYEFSYYYMASFEDGNLSNSTHTSGTRYLNVVAQGLLGSIGASPIIGSVSADLNRDNGAHLDTWVQHKNEFVATQESGTMTFRASGTNPTAVFVGLDGVKITQVPEPSSAILIALGGLTLITRRKRQ